MTQLSSSSLRAAFVLILLAALSPPPLAQEYGRIEDTQASVPGYFFFARPGEPTVAVTVVGSVGATGRFLISQGSDLADLFAIAGGSAAPPTGGEPTVRVYRRGETVYESGLRAVYGPAGDAFVLRDEDVVEATSLITTAPGYHVHSVPGQETVTVTAAGPFAAPGRYVIYRGATAGDLVALAGGLSGTTRNTEVDITSTVRVFRDGAVVFESDLTGLYGGGTPVLRESDVVDLEVIADRRTRFTFREGLGLLSAVLSLVVLVDRLTTSQ